MFKQLQSLEEFKKIIVSQTPVGILKHSNRCPISAAAHEKSEVFSEKHPIYIVDVIEQRELSQKIAQETGVRHESPQLLVFKESKLLGSKSHFDIDEEFLETYF